MKQYIISLCIFLTACADYLREEKINNDYPLFHAKRQGEADALKGRILETGVALSGGGIRSSVFTIGVLKALYDAKVLNQVDVYSFASGGGYTGYWLMSTEAKGRHGQGQKADSESKDFGYYAFDDKRFTVNTCELMTKSNFVNYPRLLGAWALGTQPYESYQSAIERSYGWFYDQQHSVINSLSQKTTNRSTTIADFKKIIQNDKKFPYFIYTMTVQEPIPGYGLTDGHFEMTPVLYGNDKFGYTCWQSETDIPISQVSAMSGAADSSLLKQSFSATFSKSCASNSDSCKEVTDTIELSDGGHSENLAILPLLRRKVKTIIAVDAEDDKDQIFEGFYKLKNRLEIWGYSVSEPILDERARITPMTNDDDFFEYEYEDEDAWWKRESLPLLNSSILTVTVRKDCDPCVTKHKGCEPEDDETTIHYIKMSRTDKRVYKAMFELWRSPGLEADYESAENKTTHARIRKFLDNTKRQSGEWECTALASTNYCGVDWAIEDAVIRMANDFDGDFPTHTTADQSFKIDQTLSYIGLGYLLGSDLGIKGSAPPVPHCGIRTNE